MSFFAGCLTAKIFFKGLIDKGTAQKAVERTQDDDIERKRLIGKQQQHQIQQTGCDQQLQRGSPFHDRHDAGIFEVRPDIHVQQHEQRIKILRDAEIEEDGNCRGDDHRASFHAKDDRVAGDGRRGKQEQESKHGPFQKVGPEFRKESVEHPFVPGLPHHIQDDPVQSAGCRRNGDHRQAAQQIQKIQSDQLDPILAQHQPDALPPGGFQCRKNTASLFFGRKCHKSTLYRAGSHSGHQIFLEENEQQNDGQRTGHSKRHQSAVVVGVLAEEALGNAHRQRAHFVGLHDGQRHQIVVPCVEEGVDTHRDQSGNHQRKQDMQQHTHPAGAVDSRRLIQRLGQRIKEALHQRNGQRKREGRVRKDQATIRVQHVPRIVKTVKRRQDDHHREHLNGGNGAEDHAASKEIIAGQCVARGNRNQQHDRDRSEGDDEAVLEKPQIGRAGKYLREVLQRRVDREEPGRHSHDNVARKQGAVDHPVNREQQHEQNDCNDHILGNLFSSIALFHFCFPP